MARARPTPKCELRPAWTERKPATEVGIDLPLCPPTNALFFNRPASQGGGRGKTRQYRAWFNEAVLVGSLQRPCRIVGPADVEIRQPPHAGDADSRIKATLDACVEIGVIADDGPRYVRNISAVRDPSRVDMRVIFRAVPPEAEAVAA